MDATRATSPAMQSQPGDAGANASRLDARSDASVPAAATSAARPIVRRRRWRAQVRATGFTSRPQSTSARARATLHAARATPSNTAGRWPVVTLQLPVHLLPRAAANDTRACLRTKRCRDSQPKQAKQGAFLAKPAPAPVAAVLASRFLASNRATTAPAARTSKRSAANGEAAASPSLHCTLAIDRQTRELMVRVSNPESEAAAALVRRLRLDSVSTSATARPTGSHGAVVLRLPAARMCEAILVATCTRVGEAASSTEVVATTATDVAPAASLSFVGAAAAVLRATTQRLVATARHVHTVLTSPASWPVLMTYVPAGSHGERWLSVDSFADVHRHITGECLDLVRHRNVEALLRVVPGVEVMRVGQRAVCRLAPQFAGEPPLADLPQVEEVPAVDAAGLRVPTTKREPVAKSALRRGSSIAMGDGPVDDECARDTEMRAEPRANPRPVKRARTSAKTVKPRVKAEPVKTEPIEPTRTPAAPLHRPSPGGGSPGLTGTTAPPARPALVADLFISAARALEEQERLLSTAAADMRRHNEATDGAALSPHCHMGVPGLSPSHWQSSDPWECLGLARSATPAQVRRRYRLLALRLHPDKCPAAHAAAAFAAVAAAYDVVACVPDASRGH